MQKKLTSEFCGYYSNSIPQSTAVLQKQKEYCYVVYK